MWMVYDGQLPPVWGIQRVTAGGGLEKYSGNMLSEGEVGRDLGKIFTWRSKTDFFATPEKKVVTALLLLSRIDFYNLVIKKPFKSTLSSGELKIRGSQNSFDFLECGVVF